MCVSEPDVPVTVSVLVPAGVAGVLEQPATTISTAIAPTKLSRVPSRRVAGSISKSRNAAITGIVCFGDTGGNLRDAGGTNALLVIVNVAAVPGAAEAFTADGVLHVALSGAPEQLRLTEPVNPPTPTTLITNVPGVPRVTVTLCVDGVSEKSGVVADAPVPFNVTVCGLPVAESVTVSVAVRAPVAPGVKVMLMVQLTDPLV